MQLVKFTRDSNPAEVGILLDEEVLPLGPVDPGSPPPSLTSILQDAARGDLPAPSPRATPIPLSSLTLLPPLDRQEVWAAGVTYLRSKVAREGESQGAASFYDLVYQADRPELFFKATPHRVVGPGAPIRIRADSTWSVPEPELALVLTSDLQLVGYTLGNDVSARDIEGRNPLYLPQAKVYDACCALGPAITLAADLPAAHRLEVRLTIQRGAGLIFSGATSLERMVRPFHDLIAWLGRDNTFPTGAVLLTGTGIVPPDDLTLLPGDVVEIHADGVGTLRNPVVQSSAT
jgi:2-dehydro-3-deoxy-D-arabinonate dehydratase